MRSASPLSDAPPLSERFVKDGAVHIALLAAAAALAVRVRRRDARRHTIPSVELDRASIASLYKQPSRDAPLK